jgi:predicted glycosyltransferase involved in capsule biosynthesis
MITVVIVGINQWEQYTKPLIESIYMVQEDVEIALVDNGSKEPYPNHDGIYSLTRFKTSVSYAQAINMGAEIGGYGDWILSLNNDVSCLGHFSHIIDNLKPDAIYGQQIIEEDAGGAHRVWLGNWLALIPAKIFQEVGGFDPNFAMCGFEDADFCIRAKALGYDTKPIDLPFHHHWGATRWSIPGYSEQRERNIQYFAKKHGYRVGTNMVVTHG